jgi:hypothetical protein
VNASPERISDPPKHKDGPVEAFERLKQLVASAEEDVRKAEGGNKAAGTRARQAMQDIKNAAQEVRQAILAARAGGEEKPAQP